MNGRETLINIPSVVVVGSLDLDSRTSTTTIIALLLTQDRSIYTFNIIAVACRCVDYNECENSLNWTILKDGLARIHQSLACWQYNLLILVMTKPPLIYYHHVFESVFLSFIHSPSQPHLYHGIRQTEYYKDVQQLNNNAQHDWKHPSILSKYNIIGINK